MSILLRQKELFRSLINQSYSDIFTQYYNQILHHLLSVIKQNDSHLLAKKQSIYTHIQTNQFIYYPTYLYYISSFNILYLPLKTYTLFNSYIHYNTYISLQDPLSYVFILNQKYIVHFIENNQLYGYLFIRVLYGDENQNQIIQKYQKQFVQQIYSLLLNDINN